ncbi:type VI secretion system baseplate subunit TssG [Massilia sp. SR12]
MQTAQRLSGLSVIQELLDAPERFQFVQAMRILLRWMGQNGVPPERVLAEVLRFENSLSLSFPPSEVSMLRVGGAQIAMTPSFFGLLGVSGTLPLHITERIAEARHRKSDEAPHAFFNLLSQRMVALYFNAWEKHRLEQTLGVQGQDGQLPLLAALAGVSAESFAGPPGVPPHVVGCYAALFGMRPVAPNSVARVLSKYFGIPIELESFVAAWDVIPENKRSKLGSSVARLGYGAALGRRIRRRDTAIRLNIGPLEAIEVERFLPRGPAASALAKILALFGLEGLQVAVRIMLQPSCIQRVVLRSRPGTARRLAWDAFLVGPGGKVSRASIDYLLAKPSRGSAAA